MPPATLSLAARRALWASVPALVAVAVAAALVALVPAAQAEEHLPDARAHQDRSHYQAAAQAVLDAYPRGSQIVVLTAGRSAPDALAGAGLSGIRGALLPVAPDELNAATGAAINELGASEAFLLGGEAAISQRVEAELRRDTGVEEVTRLGGADRIGTAARVAIEEMAPSEQIGIDPDRGRTVFLANAWTQVDAVTVAPRAHQRGHPTLLTRPHEVPARTLEALEAFGTHTVVAVGGEAVIGSAVVEQLEAEGYEVERVAGSDRYDTAAAFAEWVGDGSFGYDLTNAALANGADDDTELVRALITGTYASAWPSHHDSDPPAPLLLTGRDHLPEAAVDYLRAHAGAVERLHLLRQVTEDGETLATEVVNDARTAASE
jgi:putative cell wall-binding protein